MPLTIRLAETAEDREKVYAFRYSVYVEEMGRRQIYADHSVRRIVEPLDEKAKLMVALEGERVVGTIRSNLGIESDLGCYPFLYDMFWVGEHFPMRVSVTTKFMVSPRYRGSTLGVRLATAMYRVVQGSRVLFDFIDCNGHLETFFARLGYKRYRRPIRHPEYGEVLPMVLHLEDRAHLSEVRSPLLRAGKAHPLEGELGRQQSPLKSGITERGGGYV